MAQSTQTNTGKSKLVNIDQPLDYRDNKGNLVVNRPVMCKLSAGLFARFVRSIAEHGYANGEVLKSGAIGDTLRSLVVNYTGWQVATDGPSYVESDRVGKQVRMVRGIVGRLFSALRDKGQDKETAFMLARSMTVGIEGIEIDDDVLESVWAAPDAPAEDEAEEEEEE
jgi:hypothetical protein